MIDGSRAKTVLVLGGGIGGITAANRLRKLLDRRHRVVLVSRDADFSFAASYLWVMTGDRNPKQITRPLNRLQRRGIEVVIGEVECIDAANRTAVVSGKSIAADFLVVSLGADWATNRVPGLAEYGFTFASLPGAQLLKKELDSITSGRVTVLTAAPLYKCPAAPYEAALLIDAGLRKRGVREHVEVVVRSAEATPMPVAGVNVSTAVEQILKERHIDYVPNRQVTSVEAGLIHFGAEHEKTDLLVYMPPIKPPAVISDSSLASADGWIHADPTTLATDFDSVYSIGDNTHIVLKIGKPLPRAGVFAHAQANAVAERISASIQGKPERAEFDGRGGCFIETGAGRAAYGSGNFYADPAPRVEMHAPSRRWHWGKEAFELNVLRRWL